MLTIEQMKIKFKNESLGNGAYSGLEYTIAPIPGEQINLDDYNFEKEI